MADATDKTAIDLFLATELDRKPTTNERREIVLYLERTGEIENYREDLLAKQLHCSKRVLRKERLRAKAKFAAAISAEEATNYMAEYVRNIDNLIKEAREGLKAAPKGAIAHQQYIRIIGDLWDSKVDKLQSIGVIPKELGKLTTIKEEWVATADTDTGVVSVEAAKPGGQ